jgi:hypothetical protein
VRAGDGSAAPVEVGARVQPLLASHACPPAIVATGPRARVQRASCCRCRPAAVPSTHARCDTGLAHIWVRGHHRRPWANACTRGRWHALPTSRRCTPRRGTQRLTCSAHAPSVGRSDARQLRSHMGGDPKGLVAGGGHADRTGASPAGLGKRVASVHSEYSHARPSLDPAHAHAQGDMAGQWLRLACGTPHPR